MKKTTILKILMAVSIVVAIAIVIIDSLVLKNSFVVDVILLLVLASSFIGVVFGFDSIKNEEIRRIKDILNDNTNDMINEANVGILIYDDDYVVKWVSSLFDERNINHIGEKILTWLPELDRLLKTGSGYEVVIINDDKYRVTKKENSSSLIFKDITSEYDLTLRNRQNAYVLGLVSYDNYDELSETEEDVTYVNQNIKIPVSEYLKKMGIDYKTLRNNRLLLILNEKQYQQLLDDRFSIVETVRKESKKADLLVTLSMAFARGSDSITELDELANELLEIAQTRGGDQVISRVVGQEAIFYGGSSEAHSKQSKVKVRAISQTLKTLINQSSNVIIAGHTNADADSIGSAICTSAIVNGLQKECFVVYNQNSIDSVVNSVIKKYYDDLSQRHNLVSEEEALEHLNENTLVILVDHHSSLQSSASNILKDAKKVAIIDHHRRSADLDVDPILLYIEASSSSTCELVSEFLPYLQRKPSLAVSEANLMYLGIIIDTNHFRNRTGSRTFEACKNLRDYGADPSYCEILLQDSFINVKKEAEIINNVQKYSSKILVSTMEEGIYSRTIASVACDQMIRTNDIDAAFVICKTDEDTIIISARSNGNVNVQVIMEAMQGGGHMTAAGLQRKNEKILNIKRELVNVLNDVMKEE